MQDLQKIAKKELGQNFLANHNDINTMVGVFLELLIANTGKLLEIIEIGPGLGALTESLVDNTDNNTLIHAVELDDRFALELQKKFNSNSKIEIVHTNILDYLPRFAPREAVNIIGSLPYYITSPIIHALLYMRAQPNVCVLLVQKEVARKITALPPDASYFSTFVQTFYRTEYIQTVAKENFVPIPKVDGAIIRLRRAPFYNTINNGKNTDGGGVAESTGGVMEESPISQNELKKYEGFLHKGFSNPRKMLNKIFTEKELEKVGVDGTLRPQNLGVNTWVKMFKLLTFN